MGSLKRSVAKTDKRKRGSLKLTQKTRKQVRKEQRKQKKINKTIYFKKKSNAHADVKAAGVEGKNENTIEEIVAGRKKAVEAKEIEKLERKKKNRKKMSLKMANLEENKIIKKLEKQLKLGKRKKTTMPKSFVADGLDYLLDFCSEENRKSIVEAEKELLEDQSDDEFKADLTMAIENDLIENNNSCNSDQDETEHVDDNSSIDEGELSKNGDVIHSRESLRSEIHRGEEVDADGRDIEENTNIAINHKNLWEDIYGRKRDREGNVIHGANRYVPPAARASDCTSKVDEKLKRHLKGCLNKVAEHNIHSIANQIEEMYMTNSRNNTNHVLSNLTIEALVAPVLTPDRLICEHMMLIVILHANVGAEVGAHFLEKLITRFGEMMREPQDVENKELDNIILMISHLYNFRVYGYKLLYQILDRLTIKFTEKEIELVLLILKTVGFPLRRDNPIALKEFIQTLQQKASRETGDNSRVKFMLDILLAIKNNNVSKIPQYDPSHVERLKKVIKHVIRKGNTVTQFNISLEDLLHANENGKWWIIGSAWSSSNALLSNQTKAGEHENLQFSKKILELAKKQRMNTDTRRNIFCILMTAEDYLDAFEKLHHLGLKDQQAGEIIHVLMHCCLQEKKFNPYYAILAQKLCEYNRKYQLTIQYALWDKLKTLETCGTTQLNNMARFLTHLFVEKCLAISVLKIIQFTELDKHTMKLLRQTILAILLQKNEETCLQVFKRISISPELQTFREGLRLFITYFLKRNIDSKSAMDEKETTLKERAELVDKILTSRGSKIIF